MIACKICVVAKGLTLESPHLFKTEEEFFKHLKEVHNIEVRK